MRGRATIFMMHRFRCTDNLERGSDLNTLRAVLRRLLEDGYRLVGLEELFGRLVTPGGDLDRVVAFTIDDGYREQVVHAAPVFAELDCPVTTFVVTAFLDRKEWFWWDGIEFIFRGTARTGLNVRLPGGVRRYVWQDDGERATAQTEFTWACKDLPDEARVRAIEELAGEAAVSLPATPPPEYAPMTWDELRTAERLGMRFGPHSVSHPILSRVSAERSRWEIVESWNRLRQEAKHPVPIFAYPNGRLRDFGSREVEILREAGFVGAVRGLSGWADGDSFRETDGPYQVPRLGYPDSIGGVMRAVRGVARGQSMARALIKTIANR